VVLFLFRARVVRTADLQNAGRTSLNQQQDFDALFGGDQAFEE